MPFVRMGTSKPDTMKAGHSQEDDACAMNVGRTEGGQVDIVDEGGANEGVQGVLREFDGVHVRANHAGDDGNDVHVGDSGTDFSESNASLRNTDDRVINYRVVRLG